MTMTLMLVLLAGFVAVAYGYITAKTVMKAPAGNDRMQEIAGAIQEGAKAYLNKQYTTIAIVGAVVFVLL
ncbi:MAG: sodium/proton-translocating pyrophosphatase, partial [Pseudomonadota bacterium]